MKPNKTKAEKTITNSLKITTSQECDQSSELKYPLGYARPKERKATLRLQKNLKKLPKSIFNIKRSQKEAAKNGLTEEILEKLLSEDAA